MLFRSVAAPRVEEAAVDVKTEISDTQERVVAGPSSADAAFVGVYPQRSVMKSAANWTGKVPRGPHNCQSDLGQNHERHRERRSCE